MSVRSIQISLVWVLAASLLLVTGLVYPQTVPHAAHHAHHNAATHASVLCAWLCAAGQALEAASPVIEADLGPLGPFVRAVPEDPPLVTHWTSTSRGPPLALA
jgi:hypothetical protein